MLVCKYRKYHELNKLYSLFLIFWLVFLHRQCRCPYFHQRNLAASKSMLIKFLNHSFQDN
ncbi:hypothetical protein BpHYR1_024317 [Brachionus plicatilis]|uniref:Uncharacterized protein n=1 Tax=Brachionus plicatilis TaxID=10195 RepID=A0A3M7QPG7_BRAPC|nr:hypothetical protein BpHYR1_024317 [Brachionus plicatilis]